MAAWLDNVRFNPTLGGTTDWTYSSAVAGYQSPASAGAANGRAYKYFAIDTSNNWELGEGAWNSGTGVLPRTTVIANSLGTTAKINFAAAPQVAIVALKEDMISVEEANSFTATQRTQVRANLGAAINELQNVSFAVSASAGALTIALKDANGNDPTATTPVALTFRNASLTASPNTPTVLEVAAATSVVVPSTSTCGFSSNTAGRLWITGWNDGGTFRLGVFNASNSTNIFPLSENGLASSLQAVAAGNAAGQHYTAGAAVTSKAFRILGYVDWNSSGMTAGTWTTTNLNSIVTFGPGIKKPGDEVQTVWLPVGAADNTTTLLPYDNTVPQNTEGKEFMSQAITPSSAASILNIEMNGLLLADNTSIQVVQAMFQDSTANALVANGGWSATGNRPVAMPPLRYQARAQTTSATTFRYRAGPDSASTLRFNQNASVQNTFNGVANSYILIKELMG